MRALVAVVFFSVCSLLSGCTARYILGDAALHDAREQDVLQDLGVYVSHRLLVVYEEGKVSRKRVNRKITDETQTELADLVTNRNLAGLIVAEDLRNGAQRLWIGFSRGCREIECAYGFVQTEDGRYRLVDLPVREGIDTPKAFRSVRLQRHKLKPGKIRALSDANAVYRLERKRKKRPKTVFLEVKRTNKRRTRRRRTRETGN